MFRRGWVQLEQDSNAYLQLEYNSNAYMQLEYNSNAYLQLKEDSHHWLQEEEIYKNKIHIIYCSTVAALVSLDTMHPIKKTCNQLRTLAVSSHTRHTETEVSVQFGSHQSLSN